MDALEIDDPISDEMLLSKGEGEGDLSDEEENSMDEEASDIIPSAAEIFLDTLRRNDIANTPRHLDPSLVLRFCESSVPSTPLEEKYRAVVREMAINTLHLVRNGESMLRQYNAVSMLNASLVREREGHELELVELRSIISAMEEQERRDRSRETAVPLASLQEWPRKRASVSAREVSEAGDTCPICLEAIEEGDRVPSLSCGHLLHMECFILQSIVFSVCPLCKREVQPV